MGLKYIGAGSFYWGIPARDLSDAEIKELEDKSLMENLQNTLVESGLYERIPDKKTPSRREPQPVKETEDGQ